MPFSRFLPLVAVVVAAAAASCGQPPAPPAACTSWQPGALVITEVMANPKGEDSGAEWFEVYNPGGEALSLKGVSLVIGKAAGSDEKVHRVVADVTVEPGAYFAFSDFRDASAPEWAGYIYADKLKAMPNTGGYIAVRCGSALTLDETTYPAAPDGKSWSFDGTRDITPDATRDAAAWCEAKSTYGDGTQKGTPAAPNDSCGAISGTTCKDPDTQQQRDVAAPHAGDLVITELMADPSAVGDDVGEWIEFYAPNAFDLNGVALKVGDGTPKTFDSADCLRVGADSYVVLAKRADSAVNGGLPAPLALFTASLPQSGGTISFLSGTDVLDSYTYPASRAGKSQQLDASVTDATGNDDGAKWCVATTKPAEPPTADYGTPGAANAACDGTVVPTDTCEADGTTRDIRYPEAGDLVITEIMANPKTPVGDDKGEWIEVLVRKDVDLNGLELANDGTGKTSITGAACIPAANGTTLVFAKSIDPLVNGGIENVTAAFSFDLVNSGTHAVVLRHGLVEIDRAPYSGVTEGASKQLDKSKLTAADNDDEAAWCAGSATYGTSGTNKGTPGADNSTCAP